MAQNPKNKLKRIANKLLLAAFISVLTGIFLLATGIFPVAGFLLIFAFIGLLLAGAICRFIGGVKVISDAVNAPPEVQQAKPSEITIRELLVYFLGGFLLSIIGVAIAIYIESKKGRNMLKGTIASVAGMLCWLAIYVLFILPHLLK